jgi:hypothetical protein
VLNLIGHHLASDGKDLLPLDPEVMVDLAIKTTGLSDFGEDTTFLEGLNVLVRSLDGESELNIVGRGMLRDYIQRLLTNRLKIVRDFKQYPEIEDVEIKRPLFIVGFPRTGSTMLQRLLARDTEARSLQTWEMLHPSPPPEAVTYFTDRRIRIVERKLKQLNWMAPELAIAHEMVAGEPEECISLLQSSFVTFAFELLARMPSYRAWLADQDHRISYRFYRKQLQMLQWRNPKDHWVLKSPFHLLATEALMDVFPDATIIQTHRDPMKVLPSMCSLFNVMHQLTSDRADPLKLGPSMVSLLGGGNDRTIDIRERSGDSKFIDVAYKDLVKNPLGTVQKIGEKYGHPITPAGLAEMKYWINTNPQHKRGVHQYTLEEFGLNAEIVNRQFGRYSERFKDYI